MKNACYWFPQRNKMMIKKQIILLLLACVLFAGVVWLIWGNVTVGLTNYTVYEENIPASFDGYRIAHISDLHNSRLWKEAIRQLQNAKPDIICITGDLVDSRHTDVEMALAFASEAVKIAPCYYIPGNHELRFSDELFACLISGLKACGVTVLMDEAVILQRDNDMVSLIGRGCEKLESLPSSNGYSILLSHYPEEFSAYVAGEYDLVLSGHAHGGQVRLPFVGGLFAPGQGILPEYDSGVFTEGRTNMVVSRGIGNSGFPIRFNNRPEVILLTLRVDTSGQ